VPTGVKTRAAAILASYPKDRRLRELIEDRAIGLPIDIAVPLMAASELIAEFSCASSDLTWLTRIRRHLPTSLQIGQNIRTREPEHLLVDWRLCMGMHHWLQPDQDYVDAVVIGWLDGCAVAVSATAADGRSQDELDDLRPRYLIASSTSGVRYEDLAVLQRLRCTVSRDWGKPAEHQVCTHATPL
jgi:hypothetical protein